MCRQSEGLVRHGGRAIRSIADALMGMSADHDPQAPPRRRMPAPSFCAAGHVTTVNAAYAGTSSGALPLHLLLSDRDFREDDYEALLALDDLVENRKGELAICDQGMYPCT